MVKWRRRPHEVEAILFTGNNLAEIEKFLGVPWKVDLANPKDGRYLVWWAGKHGRVGENFLFKNQYVFKYDGNVYVRNKDEFLSEYERVQ